MAFAMSVNNLLEAMGKPGCPICRATNQGAARALEAFLWENVNEPDVRQGILDSYGFCPPHTRVMVAQEMSTSSLPLGTNIIYEHLGRVVAGELKGLRPGTAAGSVNAAGGGVKKALARLGVTKSAGPLHPRGPCPACQAGENAATNSLHVLCEELQRPPEEAARRSAPVARSAAAARAVAEAKSQSGSAGEEQHNVRAVYTASAGICLAHLRDAIENHSARFPRAVTFLIDDAVERLEAQSKGMKEYIRKNNWTYRDEKLSEEEDTAWRKTLGFFTGLAGESFIYKVDE
jgi:hypothetical protein